MKLLWLSDSPSSPSGFGNVTHFLCRGLAALGHEVHVVGWQTEERGEMDGPVQVHPRGREGVGADVLVRYILDLRPDVLITCAVTWWMAFIRHPSVDRILRRAHVPWVHYYVVDSDMGAGRLPTGWLHLLRAVDIPVTFSRYAQRVSQANGIAAGYIPLGVDLGTFRPAPDRELAKREFGYESHFVVLSDARNQVRKCLPLVLQTFKKFRARNPNALLHLHTDPDDFAAQRPDYVYRIRADVAALDLEGSVRFSSDFSVDRGWPLNRLADLYRAADAHLLLSRAEGFGLPTLQAAASGAIPIAPAHSANAELIGSHGELVRVAVHLPNEYGLLQGFADTDDAAERLARISASSSELQRKASAGLAFAKDFDWPLLARRWHELLMRRVPAVDFDAPVVPTQPIESAAANTSHLAHAFSGLPEGTRLRAKVRESRVGEIEADLARDVRGAPITIPTVPRPRRGNSRTPGLVVGVGAASSAVFARLRQILPTISLARTDASESEIDLSQRVASACLVLNLGEVATPVARIAATVGTPCIGWSSLPDQQLWDGCSPLHGDRQGAFELARRVLVDPAFAAAQVWAAEARVGATLEVAQ